MKTNYVPAYVMLTAGVIDSIFALLHKMELLAYLKQLLLVLVIFLIIGNILKLILDIGMKQMADKDEEPEVHAEPEEQPLENIDAKETEE
jgi:flagellar biosynthesis/type III secretory pathway M-ring protein FliF/YscJ